MFGIKKHVLELRKSFVVLVEAVGLQKGSKAPKKRPKAPRSSVQELDYLAYSYMLVIIKHVPKLGK